MLIDSSGLLFLSWTLSSSLPGGHDCLQVELPVIMVLREVPAENITRPLGRNEVVGLLFRLTIFGAVTYFTIKWMVDAIDPTRKQKVEAQKQVRQVGFSSRREDRGRYLGNHRNLPMETLKIGFMCSVVLV